MITQSEIIRYLGYGKNVPDERVMKMIKECSDELESAVVPRHTFRRMKVSVDGECVTVGSFLMYSKSLAINLKGCEEVIVFAASLGNAADMLMNRYQKIEVSRASVMQACAAAMIEDYCDECQRNIEIALKDEKCHLKPRFSPGYGDLSLEHQKTILRLLNANKEVGIFLTEGGMMIPEKSVTAFMGIIRDKYEYT